jgi:hypothetical protein
MMDYEKDAFRKAHHLGRVEKCCGTCRHFSEDYEEAWCTNPAQDEFDSEEQQRRKDGGAPRGPGDYNFIMVDAGNLCDLWTAKPTADELLEEMRKRASAMARGVCEPVGGDELLDFVSDLRNALKQELEIRLGKEGGAE